MTKWKKVRLAIVMRTASLFGVPVQVHQWFFSPLKYPSESKDTSHSADGMIRQ